MECLFAIRGSDFGTLPYRGLFSFSILKIIFFLSPKFMTCLNGLRRKQEY